MKMKKQALLSTLVFFFFLIFPAMGDPESVTAPMAKTELEALFMAVQGFVGSWWNGSDLYPDPCGWTPIQGISCDVFDELWYVTAVSVGPVLDNSLICSPGARFTPHLFELKRLKSLSFFNCFFNVEHPALIPSENWEKLAGSLETLEFRSNPGLAGEIPPAMGRLYNLKSLVMFDNALSGTLPQTVCELSGLRRLSLPSNGLSGGVPANLGYNMKELLILDLSGNSIAGPVPPSLGSLASLLKLDLSRNKLAGELPGELGELKKLTLLDLSDNNFSGGLSPSLGGMLSLQDMILSGNQLGGNLGAVEWAKMKNLANLQLSGTGLIGEIPDTMAGLEMLRFLALDNNKLSGGIPSGIAALPCLDALYLNGNNLAGELGFPEEFYRRMGRRFASWGNPSVCYNASVIPGDLVPRGVPKCK